MSASYCTTTSQVPQGTVCTKLERLAYQNSPIATCGIMMWRVILSTSRPRRCPPPLLARNTKCEDTKSSQNENVRSHTMISQNETFCNDYGLPGPQEKLSTRKMKSRSSSTRNASWNVDTQNASLDDQHYLTKKNLRCDEVCSRKRNHFEASDRSLLREFDDDMQKLLRLLRSTEFVGQVDPRYHSQYYVPFEERTNSGVVSGSVEVTTMNSGSSNHAKNASGNEDDFGLPRHRSKKLFRVAATDGGSKWPWV
jgi:hypothetical protein